MPGLEFSGTVLKLGKAVKPIDDWCPAVGDQVGCGCVQGSAGPARAGGGEPASERESGFRSLQCAFQKRTNAFACDTRIQVMGVTRFGGYTTHLLCDATYVRPLPAGWGKSPARVQRVGMLVRMAARWRGGNKELEFNGRGAGACVCVRACMRAHTHANACFLVHFYLREAVSLSLSLSLSLTDTRTHAHTQALRRERHFCAPP